MEIFRLFLMANLLVLPLLSAAAVHAQDTCNKLSESEVASAVGAQLKRSPINPCRFGVALKSFSIILHTGDGPQFADYATNAHKEFGDVQTVPGIGYDAIFFGPNLAVKAKWDVIFIQMLMGKTPAEKILLAKAVTQKIIAHLCPQRLTEPSSDLPSLTCAAQSFHLWQSGYLRVPGRSLLRRRMASGLGANWACLQRSARPPPTHDRL